MFLAKEEQAMLAGDYGEAIEWGMNILVKLGDYFDAESMVDISYSNVPEIFLFGEKTIPNLLAELLAKGAKVKVPTYTAPAEFDFDNPEAFEVDDDSLKSQEFVSKAMLKMGIIPTRTCPVYWAGALPTFGEHVAFGESSAVIYANSVLGARCNSEGVASALAAAITGKAPKFGFHCDDKRRGTVLVKVKKAPEVLSDWGALGYYVGEQLGDPNTVPVFIGLPPSKTYQLNRLGSALAGGAASIAMFHAVGITPEARTKNQAFHGTMPNQKLEIGENQIKHVYEKFSSEGKIDFVHFGCPHLHIEELKELASRFSGKKVHSNVRVWIFTSKSTKVIADSADYTRVLTDAGCEIICGACGISLPRKAAAKLLGSKVQVTDSMKHCYMAPTMMGDIGFKTILKPTDECVRAAILGEV